MTTFQNKTLKVYFYTFRIVTLFHNWILHIFLHNNALKVINFRFKLHSFAVFNVVPWLLTIPGIIAGGLVTKKLSSDGWTIGQTRKIVEGICMITEAICLLLIGKFLLTVIC